MVRRPALTFGSGDRNIRYWAVNEIPIMSMSIASDCLYYNPYENMGPSPGFVMPSTSSR